MKSEGWIDVQIRTAVDAAELLGTLADPAIQGGWEDQGVVHLYWSKPQWNMEAHARLNSILQGVDPGASIESDIRVEELPDQDWNRKWAQSVRSIRIGRRIVIRPSWQPVTLQEIDRQGERGRIWYSPISIARRCCCCAMHWRST